MRLIQKADSQGIDAFKMWCWRRLLRVPWTRRRSNQPVLKEINPEYSLEGHAEAETPILWPPNAKSWLIRKDPDARKDWRQEEKGMTEDQMVGWHHRLDGHGFRWTPGVGQGGLACCDSWGRKELVMTEWRNWTELNNKIPDSMSDWKPREVRYKTKPTKTKQTQTSSFLY